MPKHGYNCPLVPSLTQMREYRRKSPGARTFPSRVCSYLLHMLVLASLSFKFLGRVCVWGVTLKKAGRVNRGLLVRASHRHAYPAPRPPRVGERGAVALQSSCAIIQPPPEAGSPGTLFSYMPKWALKRSV